MFKIEGFKRLINGIFEKRDRNYVIGTQALGALFALIGGKLIALFVSPEDFGTYGIQFATFTFFSTLLIHPVIQYFKTCNTTLIPRIGVRPFITTLIAAIGISFLSISYFFYWYDGMIHWPLLVLLFLFLISSSFNSVLNDHLNITKRLIEFSKLGIIRSLSSLTFIAVFFCLGFTFISDVNAIWAMHLFGGVVGLLVFGGKYRIHFASFKVNYVTFLKKYFRFGWPLIFLALWTWVNNYFDRYAIEYFFSIEEVGIYSASYGVGSKFFLVLSPIFMIMVTPHVYSLTKKEQKKIELLRYGRVYSIVAIPILIVIYFSRNTIGDLLLSDQYSQGFYLIFWIAFAFYLFTLARLYELYFYSEQKTKIILIANILSAFLNIVLNIILLKPYGLFGAAIATCASFLVHFATIYIFLKLKFLN